MILHDIPMPRIRDRERAGLQFGSALLDYSVKPIEGLLPLIWTRAGCRRDQHKGKDRSERLDASN
jgi:hypothetical protein